MQLTASSVNVQAMTGKPFYCERLLIKTLLMMKMLAILLLAAALQVSAKTNAQTVTYTAKSQSLQKVLREIEQQTGFAIFYSLEDLKDAKKVSVDLKAVDMKLALTKILEGQRLRYEFKGNTIVISLDPSQPVTKEKQAEKSPPVSGVVQGTDGALLAGATISIKGKDISTTTDEQGRFSLPVEADDVLIISFVGYESKEIRAGRSASLTITLGRKNANLDTAILVMNTGYQSISKERSTGSFAKPDMNIVRNRTGNPNILQRLEGLVPGLTINNAPSAKNNPLLVRGLTTIGASNNVGPALTNRNPLYVVDGIPMDDVSTINPQDVADITLLRDATAASIWGSRAANGVIVITTKKGFISSKPKIQYDAYVNFQGKPDLNYIPTLNSQQYIRAAEDVFDDITYPWGTVSDWQNYRFGVPPHERIQYAQKAGMITQEQARKSLDSLGAINNKQQIKDLWYRPAMLMNHTLAVTGGQKNYTYYVSGAFTDIKSNRPGEKNNIYKLNGRQDLKIGERISLYLITDLSNTITSAKRTIEIDNRFIPYQLFRSADGKNLSMPYMQHLSDETLLDYQQRSRISLNYNPLDEFNYGTTKNNALLARNVIGATVKLLKGLRFEGSYSYVHGSDRGEVYYDLKSYPVRTEIVQFTTAPAPNSNPVYSLPVNGGTFTVNERFRKNWIIRNQLVYDRSWNAMEHAITALVGQESQEQLTTLNSSKVRGYNPLLQTYGPVDYATLGSEGLTDPVWANNSYNSILSNDAFSQQETRMRFTSYYANAAYTYLNKYTLNASARLDKSNLFGFSKSAQSQPVYAIGGKWRMGAEDFMNGIRWLRQLDLRLTYGITGNAPVPGTASSDDVIAVQPTPFFPGGTGAYISTASNPHLSWESTRNINLGIDFSWNDFLSGSIDLYSKKTSNLIGILPTNGFTGYSYIIGNVGTLENKGIELSLLSTNIRRRNFSWTTMLNISCNKNELTHFNTIAPVTTGSALIVQPYVQGYAAFAVFAYRYAGLDNLGDPQIILADGKTTKAPKATKPEDLRFMGTYQPVWSGGLSNSFSYKNWGLSVNTVFNLGHVMRRDVNQFYTGRLSQYLAGDFTTGNINVHPEFEQRWKDPNDESHTNIPAFVSNTSLSAARRDISYYTNADINVVSASYFKMRDATLSYTLPSSLLQPGGIDAIILRAQVSNIMIWKANRFNIDPEFHDAPEALRSLISNQGTISFGLNVKF